MVQPFFCRSAAVAVLRIVLVVVLILVLGTVLIVILVFVLIIHGSSSKFFSCGMPLFQYAPKIRLYPWA